MHTCTLVSIHAQHQQAVIPGSKSQAVFQFIAVLYPVLCSCCANCMLLSDNLKRLRPDCMQSHVYRSRAAGLPCKHCHAGMLGSLAYSVPFIAASQGAKLHCINHSHGS